MPLNCSIWLNRRALVVEDDPSFQSFVANTLTRLGLKVKAVSSAEEAALCIVGGSQFDFVVVDLHLPGKDGLDLIKAMKHSAGPKPRVILATGDLSEIVLDRCKEEGIEEFMVKPFGADALCRRFIQPVP
jgi:CheY-like chemotaxis protein